MLGLCCAPARTVAGGLCCRTPRMRLLFPALVLALLAASHAAEDSCEGRCEEGFDAGHKCQCDTLCVYYQSCCSDYSTVCKAKVTRGDVFALPEDDYLDYNLTVDFPTDEVPVADPTELPTSPVLVETTPESKPTPGGTLPEQPDPTTDGSGEPEELCSGKPFDAFTDLKNGSLYAFRGKYFYELDKTSVRPGYPKLISDVWGIEGPIDAAFTRINCQGKTYLFKGTQYWRFDDGALDPGYPRDISEGFEGIPNNVDAAFALPAHSYHGNERVYFFKDKYYWSYDFAQQPTQADCEKSSPSTVFKHYAFMNRDSWEDVFQLLFGSRMPGASGPRYISRDWRGLPSRLDAAMAGRIYVASSQPRRRKSRRQRKRYNHHHRSLNLGFWSWLQNDPDSAGVESDGLSGSTCEMLQSVYFFVGDKYYRVNLRTKRVDLVRPRYPRSIAQYWLDCPQPTEESA
ncbi:vitronectin [Cyanistes caeruleus]|uniref:Vitronectin n=1 Tax=Cyanistes caeruleus TaxID=156563 RepID=A0A8C0UBX9_CYACU|nr:vitronectin [Cyanistes caeruleus]XP_023794997.1 vitronectin [Cyanistes caeruleus]